MKSKTSNLAVAAALAGAVSLAVAMPAQHAQADDVRCYGIAKAGENDCEHALGRHSCNGQATSDYNGGDWVYVSSEEECSARNGKLEPFSGRNPEMPS